MTGQRRARPTADIALEKSGFEDDLDRLEAYATERASEFEMTLAEQVNVSRVIRLVRSAVAEDWERARAAEVQKSVRIVADAIEHEEPMGGCLAPLARIYEFVQDQRRSAERSAEHRCSVEQM